MITLFKLLQSVHTLAKKNQSTHTKMIPFVLYSIFNGESQCWLAATSVAVHSLWLVSEEQCYSHTLIGGRREFDPMCHNSWKCSSSFSDWWTIHQLICLFCMRLRDHTWRSVCTRVCVCACVHVCVCVCVPSVCDMWWVPPGFCFLSGRLSLPAK